LSILGSPHANPTDAHLHALKKVLRYLHGTLNLRLTLGGRYGPQSPSHMLCRRRLRKGQQHSEVPFGLSLYTMTWTHQPQV
jgi:hypothetical protein